MELNNITDEEIIKLAQNGDNDALETLLNKYRDLISLNAKNYFLIGAEQEDLQQEGMIGLLKAIKGYIQGKSSFKTFATLCIRRQILSAVRSSTTQKNSILNKATANIKEDEDNKNIIITEQISDSKYNPEQLYLTKEIIINFNEFIKNNFSSFENEVFKYMIQGYTYKEISVFLSKTPKTIDNCFQRIRKKCENWLNSY